jgi:hypothetical protein
LPDGVRGAEGAGRDVREARDPRVSLGLRREVSGSGRESASGSRALRRIESHSSVPASDISKTESGELPSEAPFVRSARWRRPRGSVPLGQPAATSAPEPPSSSSHRDCLGTASLHRLDSQPLGRSSVDLSAHSWARWMTQGATKNVSICGRKHHEAVIEGGRGLTDAEFSMRPSNSSKTDAIGILPRSFPKCRSRLTGSSPEPNIGKFRRPEEPWALTAAAHC